MKITTLMPPFPVMQFRTVDDSLRGGLSQSYMSTHPYGMRFHGTLNYSVLGAGFASQYLDSKKARLGQESTTGTVSGSSWNFDNSDGIILTLYDSHEEKFSNVSGNIRQYQLNFYDTPEKKQSDGRNASRVSYEFAFEPKFQDDEYKIKIPFSKLKPFYRGRAVDKRPLDISSITGLSFMVRSNFTKQGGDFSIVISDVSTYKEDRWSLWACIFGRPPKL